MFLRKHPAHDRAMTSYGTFLDDMGKKDAALGWWSRALYLSHHNPNLLNNLANHYSHYCQPLLAIQLYEAAVRLSPKEAVYHFNLGNMYWLFRKETAHIHGWDTPTMLAQAMEQFKLAREFDRANFEYASSYAETFYAMNFLLHNQPWQEAMAAWEHCLNMELAPEQRDFVHVHLVRISTYLRDPMTALRCFSKIRGQAHRKLAFQLLERAFPCSFAGPLQV
jgi:tetratricopeptide (TPR) repeat protein